MKDLFLQIVQLSLSAALIAGLVMLLRLVLKRSPRFILCALWALVAVRLLIPTLPESPVSMMPRSVSSGTVVEEIAARPVEATVRVRKSEPRYVKIIEKNPQIPVRYYGGEAYVEVSEKTLEAPKTVGSDIMPLLAWIWLGGVCVMMAYMTFSYFRIWRKVRVFLKDEEGVCICDAIRSPFILGLIRPRIYLPSELKDKDRGYVLAHERAHLKRMDHLWKPLGYFLLSLHWFNPVMWAAYILLCRDIEMACDEKVTGREGNAFRKAYSEALLACSAPARLVTACPLAFGEVGVKTRIRSVLNYRKPAFWILTLTLLACTVAAGCALTNRESADPSANPGVPGSEIPGTPPATTLPQPDSSSQPAQESTATLPSDWFPQETYYPRMPAWLSNLDEPQRPEQEGILQAKRVAFLPAVYQGKSLYGEAPQGARTPGPESFVFEERYRNTLILDRVNRRLIELQGESSVRAYSLDMCRDPRLLAVITRQEGGMDHSLYCVLDEESIFFFRADYPVGLLQLDVMKLPEGVKGTDVSYMESASRYADSEGLLLYSQKGWYLNREGSPEWELYEESSIFPKQGIESELACWKDPDSGRIALYNTRDGHLYGSMVDTQDWLYVPENYLFHTGQGLYVMAAREDGVSIYELEIGVHQITRTKDVEDHSLPLDQIQMGEIVPLNQGHPITANYSGFRIDLNGLAGAETVTLENGVGNHNALAFELYVNGLPAGRSHLRYLDSPGQADVIWPEEATFSREAGYRMYLASLDGLTVTLFLESDEQTYGLNMQEFWTEEGYQIVMNTRLRGPGKKMKDFIPCQPLEKYIEAGWLLRPAEGDRLDLDGDGQRDLVMVMPDGNGKVWPFADWITVELADHKILQAEEPVSYLGTQNAFADERGCNFRYGDLYYVAREEGGYDLVGELSINGRTLTQRYQLTDENRSPLQQGDDFSHAAYRNVGGYSRPLPGWEGIGDQVRQYYDWKRAGNAPVSAQDLAQLQHLFQGLFAGHFLLSEYEDVLDMDPNILFYDGVEEGPAPSVKRTDPEEQKEVLAQLGDSFGLPLFKLSRPAAEEAFLHYTGLPLSSAKKPIHFDYVEKYDAWYIQKGDTANRGYSIVDAYRHVDGSVTALWRGLGWEKDDFGLVQLKKSQDSWHIVANRFISEEELESRVSRGQMRAPGTRVLTYDAAATIGLEKNKLLFEGLPVLPVDIYHDDTLGYLILDQVSRRLIHRAASGETVAATLPAGVTRPSQLLPFWGGSPDNRIMILDPDKVVSIKFSSDFTSLETDKEIPLPEGITAKHVLDMRCENRPEGGQMGLILVTEWGNYVWEGGESGFAVTSDGWHVDRERGGEHFSLHEGSLSWTLSIPAGAQVDMGGISYGESPCLNLLLRDQAEGLSELRRYGSDGRLEAASSIAIPWDHVNQSLRHVCKGEPGYISAHRSDGLYIYYVEPGLYRLEEEVAYMDYQWTNRDDAALNGELVRLLWSEFPNVTEVADRGIAIDLDQDGTAELISIENCLSPSGRLGRSFYYNDRPVGASRTLYGNGRVVENEEPSFFVEEAGYQFFLSSLDGKTVSLMMSNADRVLALEFVPLKAPYGGIDAGAFVRVRMRGEGKEIEDFVPCQGIQKYLEEGWLVRPSEGDVLQIPGAGDVTVHMDYRAFDSGEGNFYKEYIRLGEEAPWTLLGMTSDVMLSDPYGSGGAYHRLENLSYVRMPGGGPFSWLQGWDRENNAYVIYGISEQDGALIYKEKEGGR